MVWWVATSNCPDLQWMSEIGQNLSSSSTRTLLERFSSDMQILLSFSTPLYPRMFYKLFCFATKTHLLTTVMKLSWYFNHCIFIGPQLVHSSCGYLMDLEMWRWAAKRKKTWLSFYFSGLYLLGCPGTEPPGIGWCSLALVLCGLPLGLQRTLHSLFVTSLLMSSQS